MLGWADFSSRDSRGEETAVGSRAGCSRRGVALGGRNPAVGLLAVSALAIGLGVGCAARHPAPTPTPTTVPSSSVLEQGATPTVHGKAPSESSGEAFPRLPGTDRVYPSQDPRNHATPDEPEAFPLSAAVAGSVDEDAAADSINDGQLAGSVDEDAGVEESVAISPPPSAAWSVQLLVSSSLSVARERAGALTPYFPEPPRVEPVAGLFKVRVGRCATRGEAEALRRKALELGLRDAFVVPAGLRGETRQ